MIAKTFIDRPIFATVLSIIVVLAGGASIFALPVAQYPDIIPPEVVVTANYPGANAIVVSESVASPLEQQINGTDSMIYMKSTSSDSGQMSLNVTFDIGTDPDQATIEVNNRVSAAMARLPEEVRRQGVTVKKRSSSILQVITMSSPDGTYDPVFVSNYALLNVIDALKRVPGVGDASLFGAKDYSMRLWFYPDKLAQYQLTPSDIINAVRDQNAQFAAGSLSQEPVAPDQAFTYTVTTPERFSKADDFASIIIRSDDSGAQLRLGDVARVELGSQLYNFVATHNGNAAIAIGIYLQPGANALSTTQAVREEMRQLGADFPQGLDYAIPFDTTKFVEVSIREVLKTFLEALVLVVCVVYVFLQNARATLIPLLAVPVSLIGTFAGMLLLGFSINLLTLFGMVLAIGIVVDDAIVVLENVERNMSEKGLDAKQAAIVAMQEVTGPVIAIVLVLCAVFIPVGFLGGMTGKMYQQFAITIAISVVISGGVALSLTPALCGVFLKPEHGQPLAPFRWFNAFFNWINRGYGAGVRFFINHSVIGVICFVAVIASAVGLLQKIPSGLVPEEDQGYIFSVPVLPPAAALSRTTTVADQLTKDIMTLPAVSDVVTFAGFDILSRSQKTSAGVSFITLKDWSERTAPQDDARALTGTVMGMGAKQKDALVFAFNPPPITGISLTGGFELYLQNKAGDSPEKMVSVTQQLTGAAAKRSELTGVRTTMNANVPRYQITVDRDHALALGISLTELFATMQSAFGAYYVNDFTLYGRTYRVTLQADAAFREQPEDLNRVFVRSQNGTLIPLSTVVTLERTVGPDLIERFNGFPAAKVMGGPASGFSSGQALQAMQQVASEILPAGYSIGWIGSAYQEQASGDTSIYAFGFGLIMVFLILAALYERWTLPIAVITAVPFGVLGAALAVWFRDLGNDVYFQVGLLVLIGLSAKNAILIVEFAVLEVEQGKTPIRAAIDAARMRFRPIVMTSLAFILGCLPLAISTGAGAGSRHSIGTGVIGGMLGATILAIFFVPMFFKLIVRSRSEKTSS